MSELERAAGYVSGVVIERDEQGPCGVLTCAAAGCQAHEAVRPAGPAGDLDVLFALLGFALDDGWTLGDAPRCPDHRWSRPVKGGPGASEASLATRPGGAAANP